MTQQSIYISDQGELLLIDAPEKPTRVTCAGKPSCCDYHPCERKAYEAALASAITKGIKFKDQQEVLSLLYHAGQFDKFTREELKGKIFPLPTGYKVSLEEDCQRFRDPTHLGGGVKCSEGCYFKGGGLKVCEKLAILSKLDERSEEIKNCKVLDRIKFKGNRDICANDLEKLVAPSEEVRQGENCICPQCKLPSGKVKLPDNAIGLFHPECWSIYKERCYTNNILE